MEIYEIGINKITRRAEDFLNKFNEFAPFGLILKNEEWLDLATYNETLDSTKMKDFLINTIIQDFEDKTMKFGAVCINATLKDIGNVIMIFNTSDGKDWYELCYKYHIINGNANIIMKDIEY